MNLWNMSQENPEAFPFLSDDVRNSSPPKSCKSKSKLRPPQKFSQPLIQEKDEGGDKSESSALLSTSSASSSPGKA